MASNLLFVATAVNGKPREKQVMQNGNSPKIIQVKLNRALKN